MKTGIYKIENTINSRFYIGGSVKDFRQRWSEHRSTLNKGTHRNRLLQSDWLKYGESAFRFEILETLPTERVLAREQELIDQLHDCGIQCYNRAKRAVPGGGGRPMLDSEKQKFFKVNIRPETKQEIDAIAESENRYVYELMDNMIQIYKAHLMASRQ